MGGAYQHNTAEIETKQPSKSFSRLNGEFSLNGDTFCFRMNPSLLLYRISSELDAFSADTW